MVERPFESCWDVKVPCKGTHGSQPDCPDCIWKIVCAKETAERLADKAANLIIEILNDKTPKEPVPIINTIVKSVSSLGLM